MGRQTIESLLLRTWRKRGALACLLRPLSLVYGGLAALRRRLYQAGVLRSVRVQATVIVVGNVIAGGSGKTPVVMALVRHLTARGLQVGVVSRGYGRTIAGKADACREVLPDSTPAETGDEPLMVRRSTGAPVFVGRRRADAAAALIARHPEVQVIVCDDGLQHAALQRDVEICVFDDRGVGNGWLLPAGPLREPWPRPVDLVLHTGVRPAFEGFRAVRQLAAYAVRQDGSRVPLADLRSKPVMAVAAIAQPQAFFDMLQHAGMTLASTEARPDHDDFANWSAPEGAPPTILCTEKDAAKIWRRAPQALAVPLEVTLEDGFLLALDARLDRIMPGGIADR